MALIAFTAIDATIYAIIAAMTALLQQVTAESFPIHPTIAIAKKDTTAAFVEIDLTLSGIFRKSFLLYRLYFHIVLNMDKFPLG
jgi:hypothetical protein